MTRGIRCPLRKPGSVFVNSLGDRLTIIEDVSYREVRAVYDTGTEIVIHYHDVLDLKFSDHMVPRIHGRAFNGGRNKRSGGNKQIYSTWHSILDRCYGNIEGLPTYEGVEVCEEWLNYQNFRKWYEEHPNCGEKGWHIDKDLLVGGRGKIYSPETCTMIPSEINTSIHKISHKDAGCKSIGVFFHKGMKKFAASVRYEGIAYKLGFFETEKEAAIVYKYHKEKAVRALAEKYKDKIEERAYNALSQWTLDIEGDIS